VLASKDGATTPEIVLVANVDGGYTGHKELSAHSDPNTRRVLKRISLAGSRPF
jgi:hypothetical protein